MSKPILHFIGGPTASGKTALALDLAARDNGVVINADAMQVYAGLPLLTAQPTPEEKVKCPHELFEIFDAAERSSAGRWQKLAKAAVHACADRGKTAIVVGGTGLYFRALTGGLAEMPDIPPDQHQKIVDLYDHLGHAAFRVELAKLDLDSAAKIKPNDKQRLIRAFEIVRFTDHPIGEWQRQSANNNEISQTFDIKRHVLLPDRDKLYAQCDQRFIQMVERGAIEEVRTLMARALPDDLPAMKILGVRELAAHLTGELTLEAAISKAQQATRNYAKRQMTWFRNQWKAETL